ncbi:hypothetical protein [Laspinema olomoucense]|nr:hypothetical protein [Laspinema sp. D3b]
MNEAERAAAWEGELDRLEVDATAFDYLRAARQQQQEWAPWVK